MSWTTFHCENPNLEVRSVPDGVVFAVNRSALQRSDVFSVFPMHFLGYRTDFRYAMRNNCSLGDMFACCDANEPSSRESVLELHEKSGDLAALLRLLHDPPSLPVELPRESKFDPLQYDPTTIIPLPLLKPLLSVIADKYALDQKIVRALRAHLEAHAPAHGLEVYGFASQLGLEWEASTASQYISPLASYRFEEIKVIPTVVAYHKLIRLQDFRVKALRDLLLGEELFPHGQSPLLE